MPWLSPWIAVTGDETNGVFIPLVIECVEVVSIPDKAGYPQSGSEEYSLLVRTESCNPFLEMWKAIQLVMQPVDGER